MVLTEKWPVLGRHEQAAVWLQIWTDLGRAPRTIDAYARGMAEYLLMCEREDVDPVTANRAHIAVYVRELTSRPRHRGANVVTIDSGAGLANATIQQRLVPVRLFYDFLMEEGLRESNPVGRGRYTPGRVAGGSQRGLVPRLVKLPWIPGERQWLGLLEEFRHEPVRNRLMLALAYDAALRREELCSLRTDDVDPAHRTLRIRAETTKNRLERALRPRPRLLHLHLLRAVPTSHGLRQVRLLHSERLRQGTAPRGQGEPAEDAGGDPADGGGAGRCGRWQRRPRPTAGPARRYPHASWPDAPADRCARPGGTAAGH
jgi:integrase